MLTWMIGHLRVKLVSTFRTQKWNSWIWCGCYERHTGDRPFKEFPFFNTGRYAKTVFYFLRANPMNTASITVTVRRVIFKDRQGLQIFCTILFKGEENKKNSWTCTIYDRLYAWNMVIKVWRISVSPLKYMFKFIISKTMF